MCTKAIGKQDSNMEEESTNGRMALCFRATSGWISERAKGSSSIPITLVLKATGEMT